MGQIFGSSLKKKSTAYKAGLQHPSARCSLPIKMMIVDLVIGVIAGVTSSHVSSTSEPSSHDSTSFCDSLCTINLRTELLAEQSYCDLLPFDQYADRKSYESCVVGRLIAFNLECVSLCTTNTMLPSYYDWGCDGTHKVLVCQNVSL